jgi:hypothetical protein
MEDGLTARLVEVIADATDTSPVELTPPLNDLIDAEALARVVASGDEDLRASLKYADVRVVIAGTGEIVSVTPQSFPESAVSEESPGVTSD